MFILVYLMCTTHSSLTSNEAENSAGQKSSNWDERRMKIQAGIWTSPKNTSIMRSPVVQLELGTKFIFSSRTISKLCSSSFLILLKLSHQITNHFKYLNTKNGLKFWPDNCLVTIVTNKKWKSFYHVKLALNYISQQSIRISPDKLFNKGK